jgi:predicted RNA-binding protein associated with RNAse of E/G family
MQKWIIKSGFDYCGWIFLASGAKRLAFEKRISRNRKDMHRSTWHRCLRKEYVDSDCIFRGKKAKISLSLLKELTGPLWVPDRGEKMLIADTGYSWLQLAVDGEYFFMTSMFDENGELLQLYFDLTNGILWDDPDNPSFDDMYLDLVLSTDGYIAVLDEEELEAAYAENIISKKEYEHTLEEGEKFKNYLDNNKQEMMEFCRIWYRNLREKMERR